jgi:hypothetical protein
MVNGIFHSGSGLGNQLHRYVATRVLALDKGYRFGMLNGELFKGSSFMDLDIRLPDEGDYVEWVEKKVVENGVDIRSYDPEFNFIPDNTIIDGEFQDQRYFQHRLPEINKWLRVKSLNVPDDVCIINFRGGEYTLFQDLFLPKRYWEKAIQIMLGINPDMKFEVHTDDKLTAELFFPSFPIYQDMGLNWRSIRFAKYSILSNSSFAILPALLSDAEKIIAPRGWARHNTKTWALPSNYYDRFHYIYG